MKHPHRDDAATARNGGPTHRWVWILNGDKPTPTYHAIAFGACSIMQTKCGKRCKHNRWWQFHIRHEHAVLFAKPCIKCFPSSNHCTNHTEPTQ